MANDERKPDESEEQVEATEAPEETSEASPEAAEASADAAGEASESDEQAAAMLGAARYVHAAFFLIAILGAYVSAKILVLGWGAIAEWPAAVRAVPLLVAYGEDQREGICLVIGGVLALILVIQSYRKEGVRGWADGVAEELSKVTWPARETVMNGTIVVVVASVIATVYVTVLDRFWSFLTTLVYGA